MSAALVALAAVPDESGRAEDGKAKKASAKDQQRLTWSKEEDEIILASVEEFGPKWLDIAARLPGRTDHAARNRYHRLQRCHRPADQLSAPTQLAETGAGVDPSAQQQGGDGWPQSAPEACYSSVDSDDTQRYSAMQMAAPAGY